MASPEDGRSADARERRPDPESGRSAAERQKLGEEVVRLNRALADRERIIVGMSRELVMAREAIEEIKAAQEAIAGGAR